MTLPVSVSALLLNETDVVDGPVLALVRMLLRIDKSPDVVEKAEVEDNTSVALDVEIVSVDNDGLVVLVDLDVCVLSVSELEIESVSV
jgi:hypothetical protein